MVDANTAEEAMELPGRMTMSDIADLAGVRRPVVSVWRSRPSVAGGEVMPFPASVSSVGGVEEFDGDEVVSWLERTGRGNSATVRADAAAYTRLPEVKTLDIPVEAAISALLCLKARTGATLANLDHDELLDLADELDSDDEALFREIAALGADRAALSSYADDLTEAAYDAGGALSRIEARRRLRPELGRLSLDQDARMLVGELGAALAVDMGADHVQLVDPTGWCTELVDAVMHALGEGLDASISVCDISPVSREARRAHLIRGRSLVAGPVISPGAIVLGWFPGAGDSHSDPSELLTAIDDLQLQLANGQRAIILGPAPQLCDRIDDPRVGRVRDDILRSGRLRAAVRLPKGLLSGRSRQSLGLWLVTGDPFGVALQHRQTATADLSDVGLGSAERAELVGDLVAAAAPAHLGRAHAFRFLREISTPRLLARRGDLVPRRVAAPEASRVPAAERVVEILDLMRDVDGSEPRGVGLGGCEVRVGDRPGGVRLMTLGQLVAGGRARLLPGVRLHDEVLVAGGSVRVWSPIQLLDSDSSPSLRADPITLTAQHPRSVRTEPGDIVFATAPRPRAVVDHEGLAVVRYPARILRCRTGVGLVPEAVAAALNSLPDHARAWRTWQLPLIDPADADLLGPVLLEIDERRRSSRRRLALLDRLSSALLDAVASGAVTLTARDSLKNA